uniref:Putative tick kunitz 1 n=1 Tax=Amblyomma triste TaxID=251400 RepID=A0A023GD31_AMBTT
MSRLFLLQLLCIIGAVSGAKKPLVLEREDKNKTICHTTTNLVGETCADGIEKRYTYNPKTGKCEFFVATTCGTPNANNFRSRIQCLETCNNTSPCLLPEKGSLVGFRSAFTYDRKNDICKKIKYTFGGDFWPKHNKFTTAEKCQVECTPIYQQSSS